MLCPQLPGTEDQLVYGFMGMLGLTYDELAIQCDGGHGSDIDRWPFIVERCSTLSAWPVVKGAQ